MFAFRHASPERPAPEAGEERFAAGAAARADEAAAEARVARRARRGQTQHTRIRRSGDGVVGAERPARNFGRAVAVSSRSKRRTGRLLATTAGADRRMGACARGYWKGLLVSMEKDALQVSSTAYKLECFDDLR